MSRVNAGNSLRSFDSLENGLGVRLLGRPHLRTVNLGLFIRHGSSHEERENNGISHFLEHLLWNPRHLPEPARRRLYRLVEAGARYEAFTSKEYSRFMVTCLPERFGQALEVAAAALRERTLDAAAVEEERGVLLHEHAMTFASSRILGEVLDQAVWGERGLGLFVSGRRENLQRFTVRDLEERFARFYTPERSYLFAVGPLDSQRWLEAAAPLLAWPRGTGEGPHAEAAVPEPQILSLPMRSGRVDLLFGFPAPAFGSADRWAVEILADVLGTGWRSRLFLALREGRPLAYLARASAVLYRGGGYLAVQVNCERGDVEAVFSVVAAETARLGLEGAEQEEVVRARAGKEMVLLDTLDHSAGCLQLLGRRAMLGEELDPARELAGFWAVSAADVNRVAQQCLRFEAAAVVARGLETDKLAELCDRFGAATGRMAVGER